MRIYIFLCLICWVRFGYLNFSSKSKVNTGNNNTCLKFSNLNAMDSIQGVFFLKPKIILLMYSRGNIDCAEPLFDPNNVLNIHFNLSKKTVWIIHGYRPLGSTPKWLRKFVETVLKQEDVNLIVVDWSHGATTFIYDKAVKNTRVVADNLINTIQYLLDHGASLDNFHFIGVSLGAHISGLVGKQFHGQLGRITGLDPAGPKFSNKPPDKRLDYTDAQFVDVIHSGTKVLGISKPLGHIDFYPNGGKEQPGCRKNIFSVIKSIKCDHQRAVHLFLESYETNCNFVSFPCHSYKDFKDGLCVDCGNFDKGSCPRIGYQANLWNEALKKVTGRWPFRIVAYLDTSSKDPFCTYYFTLSISGLSETINNGSISFTLLNKFGNFENPILHIKQKSFDNPQEVKILAQFVRDIDHISCICMTYRQASDTYCSTCKHRVQSLVLKSLTHPERPPLCKYNFVLKERTRTELPLGVCKTQRV